ncbi:HAD hydrolase-like protein [Nostoc sphaeroides]|uniref:GmhB, D-glycero-D-manno-heptose 1,7-bisphosphate phosphatase n=1 Tax=Nostoc sphaeroides CCNUC1 TaxID=2653204 RepID=A0A5P8WHM1_9NOSO|nr:HAD hydrolase-like protein [Nostoc sphaeroides]MCC5633439.1 HAD hydrolase-like protein [Nostoc sphaeroides CHAB 2801]QFS52367.1 gmhB, D-glycero-D-manno-heptose 1,7-bisphosphate phosphatase [Nostoc sphaeroides CCNUC1]
MKSLEDAIAEQQYTLELIPQLEAVYFCPDMKGLVVYRVTRNDAVKLADHTPDGEFLEEKFRYRKPGAGMIFRASIDFDIDLTKSWMIGDRDEDEKAAKAAGVNFMPAEIWHMRFTPGMYEIRQATQSQLEFLEGINLN